MEEELLLEEALVMTHDDDKALEEEEELEEEELEEEALEEAALASEVLLAIGGLLLCRSSAPRAHSGAVVDSPSGLLRKTEKTKGRTWLYCETSGGDSLEAIYAAVASQSCVKAALVARVGCEGGVGVFVCKSKFRELRLPWSLWGFNKGRGGQRRMAEVLSGLLSAARFGNLTVRTPSPPMPPLDMERAVRALECFSDDDLHLMAGDAKLKVHQGSSLTEVEFTLLRCWSQIRAVRARRAAGGLVREAGLEQPRPLALECFMGLGSSLIGELYDPVGSRTHKVTYAQYLADPELHLRYTACLLGPAAHGKTPLAKSSAISFAVAYQAMAYKTPANRCFYVQANSVDMLRCVQHFLKPFVPIFLDEFEAADVRQQGHLNENSLKVLCDVGEGGTVRVRYGSIVFPQQCPRLFAANCASPEAWLKRIGADPIHLEAIKKRTIFFSVSEPLVPSSAARRSAIEPTRLRAALEGGRAFLRERQ